MNDILRSVTEYAFSIGALELLGLIFGLLAVYFLIKENIWTWPAGIIYVLISFVIFWKARLYADLGLHVVFLILNIYGWYYWIFGKRGDEKEVPINHIKKRLLIITVMVTLAGIGILGYLLERYTDASLPYWDSATTVISLAGMWLTARKVIENWHFWFINDILATGIYMYKEIYFYMLLYLVYIGMAVSGYLAWKRSMEQASQS